MNTGACEMGNPTRRDAAARKVVAVACSIVSYEIGLPLGCRRMTRTLARLALYEANLPKAFEEYLKQVKGLPLGSERLLWNRKVLQKKDVALEATNQRFRNEIFDTCWAVIDRFGESSGEPPKKLD
jgi:hypothetical protein